MNCMKCGKETKDSGVFCEACLTDMRAHPVRPGTAIQIPNRPSAASIKRAAAQKRGVPIEERMASMQKLIRYLLLAIVALVLALCLCIVLLLSRPDHQPAPAEEDLGRNYSTFSPDSGT